VQAGEAQVAAGGDVPGERQCRRTRLDAATVRTHVDFDQHVEAHALLARRRVQVGDIAPVVGEHGHFRLARKACKARRLLPPDDLVRHEDVGDTARDERLGLAHLLEQTPTAPAAICLRAISAHLWLFACGRRRTAPPSTAFAMRAMFPSRASRSTTRAGVSTSSSEIPREAGGGSGMAPPF